MSEVRLVICDAQRQIHSTRHGSFANSVIAALSAEPETIEQLDVAMERFIKPGEWSYFRGFMPGVNDEPYDAGLVVIDLEARVVACHSTYCTATYAGYVPYHDGKSATDLEVQYHLSDDWELTQDVTDWRALADERRSYHLAHPSLDVRAVIYGEPLFKFIARACFESFRDQAMADEPDYSDPIYKQECDLVRQIHVRWMMTPCEDLQDQMPRQVMMSRLGFVGRSLHNREEQRSLTDQCPKGLDPQWAAYRFAGIGTHEMVIYYNMVRYLLWNCRMAVEEHVHKTSKANMTVDNFEAGQIPYLAQRCEQWLDEPEPEYYDRSPRSMIHNERARVPEGITGQEAIIDHDCPLCQMQAEMPAPVFWGLDGCDMDEDFAFSMWHDTIEQWEQEQREQEESSRRFLAKEAGRKRLGVEYPDSANAVWQTSFSAPDSPGQPMIMKLFAIGSHLSELIVDLKSPAAPDTPVTSQHRELIDRLSRAFGNLREVAQSPDPATTDALIEPVLASFCEAIDAVVAARSDLEPKCDDLQQRLQRILAPSGDVDEMLDDDVPF